MNDAQKNDGYTPIAITAVEAEKAAEPPLRQIIDVLQQVMAHTTQKSLRLLATFTP